MSELLNAIKRLNTMKGVAELSARACPNDSIQRESYEEEAAALGLALQALSAPSSEGSEKPVGEDRVEAVARAIWNDGHPTFQWDEMQEDRYAPIRVQYHSRARAAIAALSRPEQQGGGAVGEAKEVLFFASYCDGDDGEECTAKRPCAVCLGMSNVHRIPAGTPYEYVRQFAPERNATPVSDPKDLETELRERIAELEAENDRLSEERRRRKWFSPEILEAHAQFGGDMVDMQRRYDEGRK